MLLWVNATRMHTGIINRSNAVRVDLKWEFLYNLRDTMASTVLWWSSFCPFKLADKVYHHRHSFFPISGTGIQRRVPVTQTYKMSSLWMHSARWLNRKQRRLYHTHWMCDGIYAIKPRTFILAGIYIVRLRPENKLLYEWKNSPHKPYNNLDDSNLSRMIYNGKAAVLINSAAMNAMPFFR